MQHVQLGNTGLRVSRICLGMMNGVSEEVTGTLLGGMPHPVIGHE
jgi:aryl-alcohol dehydrogenase-like predicted oxidoreductase